MSVELRSLDFFIKAIVEIIVHFFSYKLGVFNSAMGCFNHVDAFIFICQFAINVRPITFRVVPK